MPQPELCKLARLPFTPVLPRTATCPAFEGPVKAALINVCKEETGKGKQLTSSEVSKYCTCAVEADGKLTNAQKWEIQSTINQKKSPATLAFVQKQNKDLQACFGPQLTGKLKTLTEQAQKAAAAKK